MIYPGSSADNQYAVTEATRAFDHGKGVPGIFFKYDLEPMSITIRERTTTLYQFLIRLVGVIGKHLCSQQVPDNIRWSLDRRRIWSARCKPRREGSDQGGRKGEGRHSFFCLVSSWDQQLLHELTVPRHGEGEQLALWPRGRLG